MLVDVYGLVQGVASAAFHSLISGLSGLREPIPGLPDDSCCLDTGPRLAWTKELFLVGKGIFTRSFSSSTKTMEPGGEEQHDSHGHFLCEASSCPWDSVAGHGRQTRPGSASRKPPTLWGSSAFYTWDFFCLYFSSNDDKLFDCWIHFKEHFLLIPSVHVNIASIRG